MLIVALALATAAGALHARETRAPLASSSDRMMYLRSAQAADRAFLSFDALAADIYWIRAIQHYGRDRRSARLEGRFELLFPLLDLTTTLDPYFNIAYRFGAIFLALPLPNGPGRPDQAFALLEKGLAQNPTRWQYAHDIGFVHYWYTGNYHAAAEWFEKAGRMPGAPQWVRPLAALTLAGGGDRPGARQLLEEMRRTGEKYVRQAAERALLQLQALDVIDALQAMVERYHASSGNYPRSLTDLVHDGWLGGLPLDATNVPYQYDAETHIVSLSSESGLAPLPRGLNGAP
jgi:hypothetical protein